VCLDSVVNHHGSESGLDAGVKDERIGSPNGSIPSSPLSEVLGVLANKSGSGSGVASPYTCEQCGLTFPNREELEKHEFSHPTQNQVNL